MEIYKLELEMAGLFHGGTTEKAQSSWLRLNGDSFKVVGRDFPYDRPKKLAQEVATQLERDYSVVLKRDALRTLQELIKVGQGLEKERREKLTFRTSGRKAASNKPEREVGGVPRAMQEAHPALVTTQRAYRACRRLEAFFDPDEWISNRYQDDPERLEELRADIRQLASAVSDLQSTMAQQLLEAAGIKAPTR